MHNNLTTLYLAFIIAIYPKEKSELRTRCRKIKSTETQQECTSKPEVESHNQIFSAPISSLLSIKKRVDGPVPIVNGPVAVVRKTGII